MSRRRMAAPEISRQYPTRHTPTHSPWATKSFVAGFSHSFGFNPQRNSASMKRLSAYNQKTNQLDQVARRIHFHLTCKTMTERNQTSIDLTTELEAAATKAGDILLDQKRVVKIAYEADPNSWLTQRMKESRQLNRASLKALLVEGGNVYALWSRDQGTDYWRLQYIGQRKSKGIRERLCQHLFSKDRRTGAQLENVQMCLKNDQDIGVSVVHVAPDEVRSAIEELLIKSNKPNWNVHG